MASFVQSFDSFDHVLRHVTDESVPVWKGMRASQDAPDSWSVKVSLDEAIKLAEFGWLNKAVTVTFSHKGVVPTGGS